MSRSLATIAGLIGVAALAVAVLTACGGGAAPANPTAAAPKAAEPTKPAAAPAATTAPAAPAAAAPAAATKAPGAAATTTFPKMTIKLGHPGVLEMSYHKGSVKFAELMKERTNGAVDVQVFQNSQLGSEKDMVEQVKNGVIQMAVTSAGMLASFDGWGSAAVLSMPYIIKGDTDEDQFPVLTKLARGPIMQEVADKAAKASGMRTLDQGWWYGTRNLTTKSKQVTKVDDIKGLKILTPDAPVQKLAMAALGASVTPMAVAELYSALQMGVVEGQENPLNTIYTSKYYEVQKYLALTGHMSQNMEVPINEKFFQSLTPEQQKVVIQAAYDAGDYQSDIQLKMNKQNLQDLKDKGIIVSTVDKKEFADKTKDAWKEFEPLFGKDLYDKMVAAQK